MTIKKTPAVDPLQIEEMRYIKHQANVDRLARIRNSFNAFPEEVRAQYALQLFCDVVKDLPQQVLRDIMRSKKYPYRLKRLIRRFIRQGADLPN